MGSIGVCIPRLQFLSPKRNRKLEPYIGNSR
jgi:hypothetical protein